jgi:hypothetical protein
MTTPVDAVHARWVGDRPSLEQILSAGDALVQVEVMFSDRGAFLDAAVAAGIAPVDGASDEGPIVVLAPLVEGAVVRATLAQLAELAASPAVLSFAESAAAERLGGSP